MVFKEWKLQPVSHLWIFIVKAKGSPIVKGPVGRLVAIFQSFKEIKSK